MKKTAFLIIFAFLIWHIHGQNVVTLHLPTPCSVSSVPQHPESNTLDFSIFPTPNDGHFTLNVTHPNHIGKIHLKVSTIEGEARYEKFFYSSGQQLQTIIKLDNASSGIYLVTLKGEQGTVTRKIIIKSR